MTRHPSPQALRGSAPEDSTGSSSRALTPTEDDGGFRGQIEQAAPNGRNSDNGLGAACRSARGAKARLDLVRVHGVADVTVEAADDQMPGRRYRRRRVHSFGHEPSEGTHEHDGARSEQDHPYGTQRRAVGGEMADSPMSQPPWHRPGENPGFQSEKQ